MRRHRVGSLVFPLSSSAQTHGNTQEPTDRGSVLLLHKSYAMRTSGLGRFVEGRVSLALNSVFLSLSFSPSLSLCSADERDRVQKKTFTKWVNKHLMKVSSLIRIYNIFVHDIIEYFFLPKDFVNAQTSAITNCFPSSCHTPFPSSLSHPIPVTPRSKEVL